MPISFKLPDLEQNPILLAETRSNKLNDFVRQLPFSDPMKAAAEIIEELQTLNSQKIALANRINALEIYRPAVIQIAESLIPQFSYASLPTSKNQKAFADTVMQLWEQMAFGYKWALIDLQNKILNINSDKSAALVIQRAIHALKETAFISYLMYRAPHKSIWKELHQLYFSALQQNVQSIITTESLNDNNESSVDAVYIQTLLLALAHPNRLSGQDIVKTNAYLKNLASEAELRALGFVESSNGVFLVELDGDQPPKAYAKNRSELNNETDLLLLTVKVAKRIHTHLKLIQDNILPSDGSLPNNALSNNYEDLLSHLIHYFGTAPLRSFNRARKNDGMELGIGIDDAHYFVPKVGNDYKNLIVKNATIKPSRWQILNVGAGGYALRKFNSSQVSMHVGDIAAIKNNESLSWEIGIIRWASINELNQLDIGFELVSPSATAIKAELPGHQKGECKALLLPEISSLKQQASIVLPRGTSKTDDILTIIQDDVESKIAITKLVERSSSFERFQYHLI